MSRSRRPLPWLVVGLLVVLPLLAVDPAVAALLVDPELLVAVGGAGLLLLRSDLRSVVHRTAVSLPVQWIRVGLLLSCRRPGTLVGSV
jgi:hypothetical protein